MNTLAQQNLQAIKAQKSFKGMAVTLLLQSRNFFGEIEGRRFQELCERQGYSFHWISSRAIANFPAFCSKVKITSQDGYELIFNI